MDADSVREALQRLVARHDCDSGHVEGAIFRLCPKSGRYGLPITLYGRIVSDHEGTLISVWSYPHWTVFPWIPLWVWFCIRFIRAPMWFIIGGIVLCILSFFIQTRRGYDLLRENVA
jgi:hypothetical protein